MRRVAYVVAVLVALGLGRLITDHVPLASSSEGPFVEHGSVGKQVHLSYADVTVADVRAAHALATPTDAPVAAAGVFVIVDLAITPLDEPTSFDGISVYDSAGRRYDPTTRAGCATTPRAQTGVATYAMICFDLPKDRLAGMDVVVARGDYGVNGSGQRRDDQARVDLGITQQRQGEMAATTTAYAAYDTSLQPIDQSPVTVTF